jgi:phosphatidate cytidylyltransferase
MSRDMPGDVHPPGGQSDGRLADLKLRLMSGSVLAIVGLAALFAGVMPFALGVAAVAVVMSWEWGRIVRGPEIDVATIVHVLCAGLAALLTTFQAAALGLAVLLVGTFLVFALMFGNRPLMSAFGVLYTGLPAIALIWIREDVPWGLNAILFLLLVVAATDTFAFLAGRLIGGPKLLERLSPKKTWSGLIGGVTAAGAAAALFAWGLGLPDIVRLALLAVCLGIISQAGDLAESALKRAYGVKDSSNLIPGHGGFMDRMDGIAAAAVAAGLAALFINPTEPARLLLFGN